MAASGRWRLNDKRKRGRRRCAAKAEAGRLRDYSNELIFVMIMHGLAPDAVSEPSSSSRSGPDDEASGEEVGAAADLEPAALLAQNKRLAGEVARLRAQIARAIALSRQVDRGWGDGAGGITA